MAPVIAQVTITLPLSRKARLRKTADAESRHTEQAAGEILRLDFFREQIVDGRMLHARHGGDVQLVEFIAAEHDARDVSHRHADAAIDRSVRRIANEIARDELRVPEE